MSYKDIVVVTDDTPECEARVNVAMHLAAVHDAHVIGVLYYRPLELSRFAEVELPKEIVAREHHLEQEVRARVRERFERLLKPSGILHEWHAAATDPVTAVSTVGRHADLTIIGQNPPDVGAYGTSRDLAEHVVLASGRPVIVIPYIGAAREIGNRVLVAWNGGREAARALADAMPILERAQRVVVLAVNPDSSRPNSPHGELPGADIARHLARHGVNVEVWRRDAKAVSVAAELLNVSADEGIDLLVIGAYGHARLRELWLGGVTRDLMESMTIPVFMSH